jgi:hypothetical protein
MLLGLLVLGVATGSIAAAAANHLGVWSLLPAMVLIGASMAAMYTAGAVGTTHSEAGRYGAGIGFFNLVRVAGSAIGAAYVAIVLQADVGAYGVVFGIGTAVALLALVASIASEGRQNVIGNPT